MEGRPAPERGSPCFFDPRHGPSVTDVDWAPPGGQTRTVPACAADAARVKDGFDPTMREVPVDGRMVPYWQAGPAYGPWAGGFFGGGLLPGLFIGSMLGGGFGGWDGGGEAGAAAGSDMGDFGSGGDFGGGDFGGGGEISAGAGTSAAAGTSERGTEFALPARVEARGTQAKESHMEHPEIDDEAAEDLDEELGRFEREDEEGDEPGELDEELEDRGDV